MRDLLQPHLRTESRPMALAIALAVLQAGLALLTPWFAGEFARNLLQDDARLAMAGLLLAWAAALIVQAGARFGSTYLLTRSGAGIIAALSRRLHDHLLALPLAFFQAQRRGDLLALYSHDITALAHFLTGTLASLIPLGVVLMGALTMMATIDGSVALLVAALTPMFFLLLKVLGRSLRPVSERLADSQGAKLALAGEQFSVMALIKGFGQRLVSGQRFEERNDQVLRLRTEQLRVQAMLAPTLQLLSALAVLVVLALSASRVREGALSVADLVTLLMYGLLFTRPVSGLANLYGEAQQARGAARRLRDVFTEMPERDEPGAPALVDAGGAIVLRGVCFAYGDDKPLYEALNLTVAGGEVVAITGSNGAGKSTLLHLLMRFIEPRTGSIHIGSQALADVALDSLRQQIALVSQDVLLIDGSIEDNIRFGTAAASHDDVRAVAVQAQAMGFIRALPEGFGTPVGEGGVKLSGGEKQRIALARALLRNPRILLLDEATAMFDPQAENDLVQSARTAFVGRTVILVTHRPASLAIADRVLRLDNGKLTEMEKSSPRVVPIKPRPEAGAP